MSFGLNIKCLPPKHFPGTHSIKIIIIIKNNLLVYCLFKRQNFPLALNALVTEWTWEENKFNKLRIVTSDSGKYFLGAAYKNAFFCCRIIVDKNTDCYRLPTYFRGSALFASSESWCHLLVLHWEEEWLFGSTWNTQDTNSDVLRR